MGYQTTSNESGTQAQLENKALKIIPAKSMQILQCKDIMIAFSYIGQHRIHIGLQFNCH